MNIKSKLFAERFFLSAFLFAKKFVHCPKLGSENVKFNFTYVRIRSHKTKRTVS